MVTLNQAVAVAWSTGRRRPGPGPAAARADPQLRRSHRLHVVRRHLLEMAGNPDEARAQYAVAARLATSIPEQHYLHAKAAGRSGLPLRGDSV